MGVSTVTEAEITESRKDTQLQVSVYPQLLLGATPTYSVFATLIRDYCLVCYLHN